MNHKCRNCMWYGLLWILELLFLQNDWLFPLSRCQFKTFYLFWNIPLQIIHFIHCSWNPMDQKGKKMLLILTGLDLQTHICSLLYLLRFPIKKSTDKILTWGGVFGSNDVKIVFYKGIGMLLGHKWQTCYWYKLIPMLDVILLENNSFEFFCQSLYWRCCTLRCFFKLNNFPLCSLGWNLDGTKTGKGRFDFHVSSIFKLKIYKTTVLNSSEKIYSINILCAPLTEHNAVRLRVLMFCAKLKIWKAKSSSQKGKSYFFTECLPIELA